MKKKVLHVINSLSPGGAEILVTNSLSTGGLCEHVENHLAYFMVPSYLNNKLDKNVQVHFLDYKGGADIFRLLRDLRKIIVENEIDIVHSHLNPAGLYTHIACWKKIPHVHTIHTTYSMDVHTSKFKLWSEKYFYLLKKNTNVILLSDFTKDDFLKSLPFKGKTFVLNNFVHDDFFDLQIRKPLDSKQLKLIAVGTLQPLKNFEYLLEVFGHLKNYNISLDIFGRGNKMEYEKCINDNQLNVKMMGHSENLKDVIGDYDLFIMPSKFEGFPLSVFEAMAAGIPTMLSAIAPLKSVVKNHAIYFKLTNANKVAQQLIDILEQRTEVKHMAFEAKKYAEKTVKRDVYISRLLSIYDQIRI